jgi:hypothetical protein
MIEKNGKKITTSVRDVKRGDRIVVAGGSLATVMCLVRIPRTKNLFVLPGGLTITGGHPIRINGEWTTAREVHNAVQTAS